ncbi:MAG: GntR family transcriptional regulator [Candidatus Heteroscillospira sp.]|jgi:GntR family transcriptional regulator
MDILISNSSGVPIYDQIFSQVKAQILSGALTEGEALPSIRLLAKELRISVITTKRAYEELEREGYIYTVPGKGSFVSGMDAELLREENLKKIESLLQEALELARGCGVSGTELSEMLKLMEEA